MKLPTTRKLFGIEGKVFEIFVAKVHDGFLRVIKETSEDGALFVSICVAENIELRQTGIPFVAPPFRKASQEECDQVAAFLGMSLHEVFEDLSPVIRYFLERWEDEPC